MRFEIATRIDRKRATQKSDTHKKNKLILYVDEKDYFCCIIYKR